MGKTFSHMVTLTPHTNHILQQKYATLTASI